MAHRIDVTLTEYELADLRRLATLARAEHDRCLVMATVAVDIEQEVSERKAAGAAIRGAELVRWMVGDREDRP
jgi:hypothetical protein